MPCLTETLKQGLVAENYPRIAQGSNSSRKSREGLFYPSCITFLLLSSSPSEQPRPFSDPNHPLLHPYNFHPILATSRPWPQHVTKQKLQVATKNNTKTALKTMIKIHQTPPHSLHLKISRGKGHWNKEHISQS